MPDLEGEIDARERRNIALELLRRFDLSLGDVEAARLISVKPR